MAPWSLEMYANARQNAADTCQKVTDMIKANQDNFFYILIDFENTLTQFKTICEACGRIDEAIASLESSGSSQVSEYQDMKADLERCRQDMFDLLARFGKIAGVGKK